MADSKIDFSFENLHFSCEGDNAWVEKQLNNVLSRIPALLTVHRKGENVVEEVIEVKEEEVKEVAKTAPRVNKTPKISVKPKKSKVAKEKVVKEKIAKEPKIKKVKAPKAEKAVKEKAVKDPVVKSDTPAKRGRKPKISEKSVAKVKEAKKKIAVVKPVVEQIDSPLSQFIVEKKVANNQVRKFLATAVFLAKSNNVSKLSTTMISRALKSYGIEKLQNASDCLNKNEKKGYCIKEGKEFIITENGYLSIE
ncbi:MAG: hypothetical protein M1445_02170 [Bacteroidetes bacterium]|nr:hypothetical protein [Bacteroidota bacterium]